MRFFAAVLGDIRYQLKYGFYFLYAFFSAIYIAALLLCPAEYKGIVGAVVILSDPAMLGCFFIGGIWLMEKSEGLHKFYGISPLHPMEYILSKGLSLALISTLSALLITWIGLRDMKQGVLLSVGILVGSAFFTVAGLIIASYSRSVNHYMLLLAPLELLIATPLLLMAFGITHPILDMLPGLALWHIISYSVGVTPLLNGGSYLILAVWLIAALVLAKHRIPKAMLLEGGEKG